MKIWIDNQLRIKDPEPRLFRAIVKQLTLPNPLFFKLKQMGNVKALYSTPREFKYYDWDKQTNILSIGRGCRGRVISFLKGANLHCDIEDKTVLPDLEKPLKSNIILRPYQENIIYEINPKENKEGIIKASTGFGKTIVALKLAEACQTKTLIIVPTLDLLTQFKNEIEKSFSFTPSIIQGKKCETGDITLGTINSVRNRILDKSLKEDAFGCVLADECQRFQPKKTRITVEYFKSRYRYGASATPERTDEQGEALHFIFGDILVDKKIPRKTPTIHVVPFYGKIDMSYKYSEVIDSQIANIERNQLIINKVLEEKKNGRKSLVLTKRIAHYEYLEAELVRRGIARERIFTLQSKSNKKKRSKMVLGLRDGSIDYDVILATMSLAAVGLDIPSLSCLVIAGDMKSRILQTQACGRPLRIFAEKPDVIIYDICDKNNLILARHGKARLEFYRNEGWEVKEVQY